MRIKYDVNTMKLLTLFESITMAKVKDCFEKNGLIIYVVEPGQIGKAVGKGASNIKRLERMTGKKLRVIEFSEDLVGFVAKLIFPNKAKDIKYEDEIVTITPEDSRSRGYLIGRAGEILRINEEIAKRYFNELKEIKVL